MRANICKPSSNFIWKSMCLALIFILTFSVYSHAGVTGPGAAWPYCRRITLSPVTPTTDLQVKITLTTGQYTNMKSDGSDLRFYDAANNTCSYWIETWLNTGTSTIWVKVPVSGTTYLYMYYGNSSATSATNGANTFDFFDDFTSALGANWTTSGSVVQSGSVVTLSNTNGTTAATLSNTNPFTPSSTSFYLETKHKEVGYNRNRFYATTGTSGGSPIAVGDYGYFSTNSTAQSSAQIFWGAFPGSTSVSNNTDYLTRWQITDGSTYNWYTLLYSTGVAVTNGSRTTTYASNIRYISIMVTEVGSTSTIVDWVRVRKYVATEPASTIGNQVANLSASITSQTNLLCYGQSNGSATVTATGGTSPYTYAWSNLQTTQTATGLSASTYTVTVTDNIGLSATATAILTQPTALSASISSQTNVLCNGQNTGSVTVAGSGGSGAYTYALGAGTYGSNGTFSGLSAASYTVHVKDANGCIFDQAVILTETTAVAATVNGQTNISCFGGSNGIITIHASGGTSPYSYSVDNGTTWISSATDPYDYSGLVANTQYKIRVKDYNSCTSPAIP